jgi:NAD(P)-dependent dehydrogenase (short-subunit alcohol dehydrogenase family)
MNNEAVLVTGASTGIGYEAAMHLASSGYTVFAGTRKEADRQRLEAAHPAIHPIVLDVTVPADVARAVETIAASALPLRGVINNAGVAVAGPLEFLPLEEIRRQFEINVFGPMAIAQASLPLLRTSNGRLIFVGSIAGRLSAPFVGPYSSSKAALASLVDALRQELASSGIHVSLLEFASVKTPIWKKGREGKDRLLGMMPAAATERYGRLVDAIVKQTEREEREGMDPRLIAMTMLQALRAERPRERYLIGTKAKIQAVVAMLPPATRDRLVKSAMRLP